MEEDAVAQVIGENGRQPEVDEVQRKEENAIVGQQEADDDLELQAQIE